ncbi:TlyA family RNA methyltransferase [Garciella nitratireducens]|uniref:23S rRNA (Cytidine1920-2'-O)/16S rRNA (Cytidine1409-2'-O)-methyltransferase n=1 Tax=Garciella nitratireducens DSM 15102 TaxID=1121911 RepID=A0A1T4K3C2_9FIRM|nr:TlyA family RNA methyltransferase [Garciella nitratireducens]RBP46651.1 23S rRNA (cytidine1920-2'-O)/16S rRNA (cytidine1409-2'-O)-methyltransferase [Garciella nitratireducens]SJZ36960.1 23S rRNA (cytidine1920-2'-O)/16S rRNA (cytidine1409-2'-O)-methyltransferase [Garciella nitratireducens DSM 15102]
MKKRLDIILYEKGFFQSRERAKAAIMEGIVFVNGQRKDKPGEKIEENLKIEVKGNHIPYVSRGGLKLEKALKVFSFDVKDKIIMDIGASTGGFTDCLLQHGAKKVFSIDVGYGQLAWKLRTDPRVICMERINFRYLERKAIQELIDVATIDVSFISLSIILDNLYSFLKKDGEVIALIKPQFEAGKEKVGKKGVISDPQVHIGVLEKVVKKMNKKGFYVKGLSFSPITGPKGNIEFLSYLSKDKIQQITNIKEEIKRIVQKAHKELK